MRIFIGDMNIFIFVADGTGRRPLQDKKAANIRYTDFVQLLHL